MQCMATKAVCHLDPIYFLGVATEQVQVEGLAKLSANIKGETKEEIKVAERCAECDEDEKPGVGEQ